MPEKLKRELQARYADLPEKRRNAAVYGTLRKTGWKPSREKRKGQRAGAQLKALEGR